MNRKFCLLLFLLAGIYNVSFAQGSEWVMEVNVVYKFSGECDFGQKIEEAYLSFNGKLINFRFGSVEGNEINAVFKGTDWSSIANKTINIAVRGTCSHVFPSSDLSVFNSACNTISFTTTGTNPPGSTTTTIKFYPKLEPLISRSCEQVTLTASSCSSKGTYTWELSSDGATFNPISKTGYRVTLTAAELVSLGFSDPYAPLRARVKDPGLPERTLGSVSFNLYAPPPTVSISGTTDVICNGESNGAVTLQISNTVSAVDQFRMNCDNLDNPEHNLPIDDGIVSGSNAINGLAAGRWQLTVLNNDEVSTYGACGTTLYHTVLEPTKVTVGFDVPLHKGYAIACNGANTGEATAVGSGGVGGYKDFAWSAGAATDKITGLTAGTYTVTLKDANNCGATGQVILTQPEVLSVSLSPSTNYNGYPISCWDKRDGGISASVVGGVADYTYSWTNGATTNPVTGLDARSHEVTITDGNGCTASSSLALTAPPPIDFGIQQLTTLTCPGDKTASFEVSNVVNTIGTVSYLWSSGETNKSIDAKGAGTYSLTVSDQQGCSAVKSKVLTDPPAHTVSIVPVSNYNGAFIKCNGDNNGELAAKVHDPDGTETTAQNYLWMKDGVKIGENPSLQSVNGLSEGEYRVLVTYGNYCEASAAYILSDPDPIAVTAQATTNYNGQSISCYNAADANIKATVEGGTGSYTYSWHTGATGSLLSGVGAGAYVVSVKDINECTGVGKITIENPERVLASVVSTSDYSGYGVSCAGASDGSITVACSGGTGVYSYAWSNGKNTTAVTALEAGAYSVTVSDNNGCQHTVGQTLTSPPVLALTVARKKDVSCFGGSDGEIELEASGGAGTYRYSKDGVSWQAEKVFGALSKGSYTLRLQDNNGCTQTVSPVLTHPAKITIGFTDIAPAFCDNPVGTARAVVNGGVGDYSYRWEDSDQNVTGADPVLSSAKGGIYTVIVQDANACRMSESVAITSTDGAKSSYVATAARCFDSSDGGATITISEGDGPFVVQWPDGQNALQGVNLKKGSYDVLITDGHHCTVVQTVEVPAPHKLQLGIKSKTIPTCNASCDGRLALEATGGVGGYLYEWNNRSGAEQLQLCAGRYPVVIEDANGCRLAEVVELSQPDPIEVAVINAVMPTCKDGCDGSLQILATGGNREYQYSWAIGGNTTVKTNICSGAYQVAVTDEKGCWGESTVALSNAPPLPLNLGGSATLCVGQSHTLNAGDQWADVKWGSNTGFTSTTPSITIKDAGSYWLEVQNDKGCVGQDTFLLETSYDLLQASFMIPKEAFAGDTVVMIDISWPLPETVAWGYPKHMREILNSGDVLFGQFDEAGTYAVNLTAQLGECVDTISKFISILDGEEEAEGGRLGYEEFVKEFNVYPNPNNGSFDASIGLAESSPVTLSIWHSVSGVMIRQVQQSGDKTYQMHFDLRSLSSGTYTLRLDHAKGKKYFRFIVY